MVSIVAGVKLGFAVFVRDFAAGFFGIGASFRGKCK